MERSTSGKVTGYEQLGRSSRGKPNPRSKDGCKIESASQHYDTKEEPYRRCMSSTDALKPRSEANPDRSNNEAFNRSRKR